MANTLQKANQELTPWSEELTPVIPGYQEHTKEQPFCWDDGCPCREDQDAIADLNGRYQDGLVSRDDVDLIYHGHTV